MTLRSLLLTGAAGLLAIPLVSGAWMASSLPRVPGTVDLMDGRAERLKAVADAGTSVLQGPAGGGDVPAHRDQ